MISVACKLTPRKPLRFHSPDSEICLGLSLPLHFSWVGSAHRGVTTTPSALEHGVPSLNRIVSEHASLAVGHWKLWWCPVKRSQ